MGDVRVTSATARLSVGVTILACMLWPAAARGEQVARVDSGEQIGVLEVVTFGLSQAVGDKFEQSMEETLAGNGVRVVRSRTVQQQLMGSSYISGCTFGPCLKEVMKRTGLRRVLVARIQGAGQSYSVIVSLVDTQTGHLVAQVAEPCPACTVEEAITTSTLAVVELLTNERIAADAAGVRALSASSARAEMRQEEVAILAERLEVRRRQVRRAGWIFMGSAALAIGVGAGLIATDRRDSGVAAVAAGGGLAVAGLSALIWSKTF